MTVRLTVSSTGGSGGGAVVGPKKTFLETGPRPPLNKGLDDRPLPPPQSQSLDPALSRTLF